VYRNDALGVQEIERRRPDYLVISPGPGRPEDAGVFDRDHPVFLRSDSHPRGLFGSSGHWRCLRSPHRAGQAAHAREGFPDWARRQEDLQRFGAAFGCNALPFPRDRRGRITGLSDCDSHFEEGEIMGSGTVAFPWKESIPPRVHSDRCGKDMLKNF